MTGTDDLIADLAQQGAGPGPHTKRRFFVPLAVVSLLCGIVLVAILGMPFQAVPYVGISPYVMKWAFSLVLVVGGALALHALCKPGRDARLQMRLLALPFVVVALFTVIEVLMLEPRFPGVTWLRCLAAMALLSPLAFTGAIVAARWLAPTDLHSAGLAAGLFGGGVAATAYAPFCPELGALYMLTFYCMPILVMGAIGWLCGPRLLRW